MKIFGLIITTKKKHDDFTIKCMEILERQNKLSNWSTIRPVIHSLKELRKNTWDKNRVDNAIKSLTENFEVLND